MPQPQEEAEEHGNSVKIEITCITPVLQAFLDFFPDIISFQHVLHLGVGRSQIEWKLKVKTEILVFPWANIGQNDHSNPFIESTTVLSDYVYYVYIHLFISGTKNRSRVGICFPAIQ